MSKVLISFLGTAQPKERTYRKARYRFDNDQEFECSFITQALARYYEIDKFILIGTVKSMWEEVYRTFAPQPDDNVYFELYEHCITASAQSELYLPYRQEIETVLGKGSKVVLVKYGLNEEEILYNSSSILQLEQYLHSGDRLWIDITHSFRSLPLFLMNSLIYLQNVSPKHISIEHISYGMLDVTSELGYTPVIELKSIMEVNEWISGAYSFMEFGNAYKIAHLLEDGYKNVSRRLIKFSDTKNLNYLDAIEKQIQELQGLHMDNLPPIAQLVIAPVVKKFLAYFQHCNSHSHFQYKLARWYFENHHYSSAYLVFVEAIISYVCERKGYNENSIQDRNHAKDTLFTDPQLASLSRIYHQVNDIRKQIAHHVRGNRGVAQMIRTLENHLLTFEEFYNT